MLKSVNLIVKFLSRTLFFITALVLFIINPEWLDFTSVGGSLYLTLFFVVVWIVLAVEMVRRLVPNIKLTIGARKHFANSFIRAAKSISMEKFKEIVRKLHKGAMISGIAWILFNTILFSILHLTVTITPAVVFLIAMTYGLMDMICVLFYCPFQRLFMKNKCCAVCRIHNWDFFMMCTPFILIRSAYAWTLAMLAIVVLLRWEITALIKPERFISETNENLNCDKCKDKLCRIKKKKRGHLQGIE